MTTFLAESGRHDDISYQSSDIFRTRAAVISASFCLGAPPALAVASSLEKTVACWEKRAASFGGKLLRALGHQPSSAWASLECTGCALHRAGSVRKRKRMDGKGGKDFPACALDPALGETPGAQTDRADFLAARSNRRASRR
jgi:hypothetical protein